jgi:hypothetical protein
MTVDTKTDSLVAAIERRLTDISEQQHALAVEKARLLEPLTSLRLRVLAPDTALAQLKAVGVTLRKLKPAPTAAPSPRPTALKAVASIRRPPSPIPLATSQAPSTTAASLAKLAP